MDQKSLNQIRQIAIEVTEVVESRLRGEIEDVKRHTSVLVEHIEQKIELLADHYLVRATLLTAS